MGREGVKQVDLSGFQIAAATVEGVSTTLVMVAVVSDMDSGRGRTPLNRGAG